ADPARPRREGGALLRLPRRGSLRRPPEADRGAPARSCRLHRAPSRDHAEGAMTRSACAAGGGLAFRLRALLAVRLARLPLRAALRTRLRLGLAFVLVDVQRLAVRPEALVALVLGQVRARVARDPPAHHEQRDEDAAGDEVERRTADVVLAAGARGLRRGRLLRLGGRQLAVEGVAVLGERAGGREQDEDEGEDGE